MCNIITSEGDDDKEDTCTTQTDMWSHAFYVKRFMDDLHHRMINPEI